MRSGPEVRGPKVRRTRGERRARGRVLVGVTEVSKLKHRFFDVAADDVEPPSREDGHTDPLLVVLDPTQTPAPWAEVSDQTGVRPRRVRSRARGRVRAATTPGDRRSEHPVPRPRHGRRRPGVTLGRASGHSHPGPSGCPRRLGWTGPLERDPGRAHPPAGDPSPRTRLVAREGVGREVQVGRQGGSPWVVPETPRRPSSGAESPRGQSQLREGSWVLEVGLSVAGEGEGPASRLTQTVEPETVVHP